MKRFNGRNRKGLSLGYKGYRGYEQRLSDSARDEAEILDDILAYRSDLDSFGGAEDGEWVITHEDNYALIHIQMYEDSLKAYVNETIEAREDMFSDRFIERLRDPRLGDLDLEDEIRETLIRFIEDSTDLSEPIDVLRAPAGKESIEKWLYGVIKTSIENEQDTRSSFFDMVERNRDMADYAKKRKGYRGYKKSLSKEYRGYGSRRLSSVRK